jgi:PTH1 family peptidyl-tRNA hydrolase
LGNPGREYERTRHNVGFMAVDALAKRYGAAAWKSKDGARQVYDSTRKVVFVQPQTYMNNSGVPIRLVASWYRTPPEDLLVMYDDMDLPFGKLRMRPFGGHGGHNGMRSIIATMTAAFPRIRIGVGRPERAAYAADPIDYVLGPFDGAERAALPGIVEAAANGAALWLEESLEAAMQFVNAFTL